MCNALFAKVLLIAFEKWFLFSSRCT